MSELNPPWALENRADHHSNTMRRTLEALMTRGEGVRDAADLAVTQRGAGANMSVDVAKGSCVVYGDENEFQGVYGCVNDATVNVVIAAADATNPRRDLIVARVKDAFYSGATNAWSLEVVQGTAAASPADPTVPSNCLTLARVAVAAAASSITNANITDLRPYTPVGVFLINSARPPGTLYGPFSQEPSFKPTAREGLIVVETDTDLAKLHDGSSLVPFGQYARAWTFIAEANLGSDTGISFTSIPQTFVDLKIEAYLRGNVASTPLDLFMRMNGLSTATYDSWSQTDGAAGASSVAATAALVGGLPGTTSTAGVFGTFEMLIPNYVQATNRKMCQCWGGFIDNLPSARMIMSQAANRGTGACTQIDLYCNTAGGGVGTNGFKSGSRATLLGRR